MKWYLMMVLSLFATVVQAGETKRVLIVTGNDYPGHKWRETTPVLKAAIAQDKRLEVTVTEDPKFLGSPDLKKFDVIVLHYMNWQDPGPGAAAQENLRETIAGGTGLVMVHFACGAFQGWSEFVKIAGRIWDPKLRGHDPFGPFRVNLADRTHPITAEMESFDTTDELYTCLTGNTPMKELANATSKVDKKDYPMAFVLNYGKGRVFQCLLGHNVQALSVPAVGQLYCRATAWAAGLELSGKNQTGFVAEGNEFTFDTGMLSGTLREKGRSVGVSSLLDKRMETKIAQFNGLLSPYRLLTSDGRFGDGAWDWQSTARVLPDGAVEVKWQADATHPFDMTAVYRWASSSSLDVTISVVAGQELRKFEVFLASYFEGFPAVFGYTKQGFVEVTKPMGNWLAFPRDDAAAALISDGRWQRPPHPVTFKPLMPYGGALGMRRDAKTSLAALVMAPPSDCFAVLMPYGEESHRSLYLSLFGRDFKVGESATAHARLIIAHDLTDEQAVELYKIYLKELKP
jgi:type 1 glutamine amidotransferase